MNDPCPYRPLRCRNGYSDRQYELDPEILKAAGLNEDWITSTMRCSYCGLVYSVEYRFEDHTKIVTPRGRFGRNTLMTKENWAPISNPERSWKDMRRR